MSYARFNHGDLLEEEPEVLLVIHVERFLVWEPNERGIAESVVSFQGAMLTIYKLPRLNTILLLACDDASPGWFWIDLTEAESMRWVYFPPTGRVLGVLDCESDFRMCMVFRDHNALLRLRRHIVYEYVMWASEQDRGAEELEVQGLLLDEETGQTLQLQQVLEALQELCRRDDEAATE